MQGAVDLGGIEEGHPKIDRLTQGDHLGLVGRRAAVCAHALTAEADGTTTRPLRPNSRVFIWLLRVGD
jgi:hypothetical protein